MTLLLAVGLGACTRASTPSGYSLTNPQADARYLVAWDTIGRECSATAGRIPLEAFVRRGEEVELAPGESVTLPHDSPALWASTRILREGDPNTGNLRSLSVEISLVESNAALEEMVAAAAQLGVTLTGAPVASGVGESSIPGGSSVVGAAAANRLMVRIGSISAGELSAYCDRQAVQALVDGVVQRLATVQPGS